MKRIRELIVFGSALICSLLLLLACGSRPEEGVIIEKRHEPEARWVQTVRIQTSPDNPASILEIPMMHYDTEDWILILEGEHEGKVVKRSVYVAKQEYNHFEIGDNYLLKPDAVFEDEIIKYKATREQIEQFGVKEDSSVH